MAASDPLDDANDSWEVTLTSRSLTTGSSLSLDFNRPANGAGIVIFRVEEEEDVWTLSAPVLSDLANPTACTCEGVNSLPSGLYMLTAIFSSDEARHTSIKSPIRPPLLFEIRPQSDAPRPLAEIEEAYRRVVNRRQSGLAAGIGSGNTSAEVLIFVKDLLTTHRLNLGTHQVVPLEPVGWSAETKAVDEFLQNNGSPPLPWTEEALRQVSLAEPATLIHFPAVHADSLQDCAAAALQEASLIVTLLSAHRGSFGDIFCSIVFDKETGRLLPNLHIPPYPGNLIGGTFSGEDPEAIRRSLQVLRANSTLQFYVLLLGEALRERRPEFRYVRLWSLLETIAKGQSYEGRPVRDWIGVLQQDSKGKPLIIRHAREQVYELLRESLSPRQIGEQSLAGTLTFGTLSQQTRIWYRRRNCTAHGDSKCVCRDPSKLPNADSSYSDCSEARRDHQPGHDGYLSALQEVARLVVLGLIRDRWTPPATRTNGL